ncbi:GNAT family N-acetyltransferase [Streptomyces iconiensis]|uniref:GNAT family N-acetyltransferase n=1 Tax=Streptomyces iconiensis TaxID=1384038 RepID=A0ABT6ZUF5_9ACTN|nr:GNAT family N-acetyltransferase [Streptomyces iconiensis]MDJ1132705.1 GNAT family N-acetyltransferase [Streptomyces iconiensis]
MRVREMTEDDIDAVSEVRVRGWQYAGLVPQHHLDAMTPEKDAAERRGFFSTSRAFLDNLVAEEEDGSITGWAAVGPQREEEGPPKGPGLPGEDGELYALYVRPDRIGTGTGRALMEAALVVAERRGHPRLTLWVLGDNHRARRFYEKAGFAPDGVTHTFVIAGASLPDVRYARALG